MNAIASTINPPGYSKLLLRSYDGLTHRMVSTLEPRDCTPDEVPCIDLAGMVGDFEARKSVAREVLYAAETCGFFYIKNHGVSEDVIESAHEKAKEFFHSPSDKKRKSAARSNISSYGYHGVYERHVNPGSSSDRKEGFSFHYEPEFDPIHRDQRSKIPEAVKQHLPKDKFIWENMEVPGFKDSVLAYYQSCLTLSRQLVRMIALGLDLPEEYFDPMTTYPGGDCALNFYPGHGNKIIENLDEVGLGAHTDLQIFTLLWQDQHRGLQVLNKQNEWIFAPAIPGTFVVNIGDFLMRLTNDRLKSTVHRVIQHGEHDRYSMPFFFGFNFNEKLGVLSTCTSKDNPAKYKAATCGELIAKRLAIFADSTKITK